MRVVYRHYRMCEATGRMSRYRRGRTKGVPAVCGGMTHCVIRGDDGSVVSVGISLCSPRDNFCYATGRKIARERAEAGEYLEWPEWAAEHVSAQYRERAAMEGWVGEWEVGVYGRSEES